MSTFVLRERNVDDANEEAKGLTCALEGVLSEVRAKSDEAVVRMRGWALVLTAAVLIGGLTVWQNQEVGWLFVFGGGAIALLGIVEAHSSKWALRAALDKSEQWVRLYRFTCEWSEPDLNGKRWAAITNPLLPVEEKPD